MIRTVLRALEEEFGNDDHDVREIRRLVARKYWQYRDARVRSFIPTLVHRGARDELRNREVSDAGGSSVQVRTA